MGAAPSPGRAGYGRADRLGEPAVGVAGGQGDAGQAAVHAGSVKGTTSPCVLHTFCDRSAQAERYVLPEKHTTGGSQMRLARFGCRWGQGASLSSPEHTEPSLTPAVSRRAGTADLRAPRPKGQGRCAMANAATEGIAHDDVSRADARNGGNC